MTHPRNNWNSSGRQIQTGETKGAGMPTTRARSLAAVKEGDVIYAIAAGGQEKLLLVYKTTPDTIMARQVTSGTRVEFGRDGRSTKVEGGGSGVIVSVARLPTREYDVAIGLDRKFRNAKEPTDFRLSPAEKQLLLTMTDFFKSRPLPEA
jgi:hypothetical protein